MTKALTGKLSHPLSFRDWLQLLQKEFAFHDLEALEKAHQLLTQVPTHYRENLLRSMEIATIIASLKFDQETILAGFLTPLSPDFPTVAEKIKKELGEKMQHLLEELYQFELLTKTPAKKSQEELNTLRKMLLAMASDLRVVIIKLAERLTFMRSIKHAPLDIATKNAHAADVLNIYAPLANRLGIGQLKWELEDLAFYYLETEQYKSIAKQLAERRADRENRIQTLIAFLTEKLTAQQIDAKVTGRAKHIYSIFAKMKRKQSDLVEIYDCNALRVLVNTIKDCYSTLSIVHTLWSPIIEEFDDYIAHPKPNGYRSIHTAVLDETGKHLEIQIRTHDMHEEAELGIAAHWLYKEKRTSTTQENSKIGYLRQLLDWHKEVSEKESPEKSTLTQSDSVYAITPKGDILELPMGATPLDFAYHLHSELGHRCRGAKINGHIVPLTYHLRTGDKVDLLTTPKGNPSRDWLNPELGYLQTARARSKVRHWFKQQLELSHEEDKEKTQRQLLQKAQEKPQVHTTHVLAKEPTLAFKEHADLLTRLAKCCKPIPGDEVIGYITIGRGISLHKISCKNIANFSDPKRFIEMALNPNQIQSFPANIIIASLDAKNCLSDLTGLLNAENIPILSMQSSLHGKQRKNVVKITLQMSSQLQLDHIIKRIQQLPHVIEARRD